MHELSSVPAIRVRNANDAPIAADNTYVLYWMVTARRLEWNFALQQALHWAEQLGKPLVIFEPLRSDYPWAADRFHQFVIDGMLEKSIRLEKSPVLYYAYVEPEEGAGRGLLKALADDASVVVTDDFPAFFLPRMVDAAAHSLAVRLEVVDSNGLLPLAATERDYPSAYVFRRFLQRTLGEHLTRMPQRDPLGTVELSGPATVRNEIEQKYPSLDKFELKDQALTASLPIDHRVGPTSRRGGSFAAARRLSEFIEERLGRYDDDRNRPSGTATSELSPYLHFGHISAHHVFAAIAASENWTIDDLGDETRGHRRGWWGMRDNAEAFLDQLVTWRELGFNMCWQRDDFDRYESLPDWARTTLDEHRDDPRAHTYSLEEFEAAATHDELWNAAQRQLAIDGTIHNYMRMLWGKKILGWSATPEDALAVMLELNNKYALDGRDPNSYSGIFWILGRYDRAWGPARPIFGKPRFMSSKNTARKLPVREYLDKYSGAGEQMNLEPVSC